MGEYLALWDSSTGFYPRDGKMAFEPITENYKLAVSNLANWYKEGFNMVAVAPFADQNGNVKERERRYAECGWGISSQCKDPEALI